MDIIGNAVKLPLMSRAGKAIQTMSHAPPEHVVSIE
jgi:hypothetical protein